MQAIMISGESEIASLVIKESEEEGEDAQKFLEEVRVSFPQVYKDKSLSMNSIFPVRLEHVEQKY